jgi:predicted nucleotidyltransferase
MVVRRPSLTKNSTPVRPQDSVFAFDAAEAYIAAMANSVRSRSEVLEVLRAHESELRVRGIEGLTLFGSMARDDARSASDVDLAMRPGMGFSTGGFDHFGQLDALREHLSKVLNCKVDLIEEMRRVGV